MHKQTVKPHLIQQPEFSLNVGVVLWPPLKLLLTHEFPLLEGNPGHQHRERVLPTLPAQQSCKGLIPMVDGVHSPGAMVQLGVTEVVQGFRLPDLSNV